MRKHNVFIPKHLLVCSHYSENRKFHHYCQRQEQQGSFSGRIFMNQHQLVLFNGTYYIGPDEQKEGYRWMNTNKLTLECCLCLNFSTQVGRERLNLRGVWGGKRHYFECPASWICVVSIFPREYFFLWFSPVLGCKIHKSQVLVCLDVLMT